MATPSLPSVGGHRLAAGLAALAAGRWEDAVDILESEVGNSLPSTGLAEAFAALSEGLWWLGRNAEALSARARAYEVWHRVGDDGSAARAAAWLATEHGATSGRGAVAEGWLARAQTLAEVAGDSGVAGWVVLSRAALALDTASQVAMAGEALTLARAARDGDLEMRALSRLGVANVAAGNLEVGLGCLDEAMAAATGGDAGLSTLAALCCDLVRAAELSGETDRFAQWQEVIASVAVRHGHPPLIAFCSTCCAEVFTAAGDWAGAEQQLRAALGRLQQSGQDVRCVAPTAKLADLLVAQGRLEEAERLLAGEVSDDALLARARLALAHGDAATAVALAQRHIRRLGGDSLSTTASMMLLVDAHVAAGDVDNARDVADRLDALARTSGHRRTLGRAALARARVIGDDPTRIEACLEEALDHLAAVAPGAIETAHAHFELARLRAADAPRLAITEAKAALAGFEAAGATHGVDATAALLRALGDRTRVGRKNLGVLTRREQEVLRLIAEGLSNREIAQRLFISTKTASNHVSHILIKLGVRSRTEAATYAAQHTEKWLSGAPSNR